MKHTMSTLDSFGYSFIADSVGLVSTALMSLVPRAVEIGEIPVTQNDGHYIPPWPRGVRDGIVW